MGTIVLLILGSTSGWASTLTVPNAFVSGTKAVAADVNANFDAAKTAVDDNDTRITTNTAGIATNASAIGTKAAASDVTTNTAAIATNTTAIAVNASAIGTKAAATNVTTNTAAIATNTTAIATNATAIGTKAAAADVTTNSATIATNTTSIATNAGDISANTANIATNITGIATNAANITTNTTSIATNAANITTNVTDISTNATNITTNTTDIAGLQQDGNKSGTACAGNDANDIMVRVGPLCVDKYEASVWSTADGSTSGLQLGTTADDYSDGSVNGIVCSDNANDCTGASTIYARSETGVLPSSSITWFQAQQACAVSGKRLLSNAEWQMAAAGTNKANCNISGGVTGNTDGNPMCVSNWGTINMVGNVNEWVADWIQGTTTTSITADANGVLNAVTFKVPTYGTSALGATYDNDSTSGIQQSGGTNFPAAVYRGGGSGGGGVFTFNASFPPSNFSTVVGFRCAR